MTAWPIVVGPVAAAVGVLTGFGAVRHRVIRSARAVAVRPARRAGRPYTAARRVVLVGGLGLAVIAAGPAAGGVAAAVVILVRQLRPLLAERRRRRHVERDLPDAIDLLVLGVRAGLTPRQGMELLARSAPHSIRPACGEVVHQVDRGTAFADALATTGGRLGRTGRAVTDVLATADRYGFPLAPVLDQLVGEARATRRRLAEADARRLPVRLSFPLVVCTLPSFVLLAIAPAVVAALSSLGTSSW